MKERFVAGSTGVVGARVEVVVHGGREGGSEMRLNRRSADEEEVEILG